MQNQSHENWQGKCTFWHQQEVFHTLMYSMSYLPHCGHITVLDEGKKSQIDSDFLKNIKCSSIVDVKKYRRKIVINIGQIGNLIGDSYMNKLCWHQPTFWSGITTLEVLFVILQCCSSLETKWIDRNVSYSNPFIGLVPGNLCSWCKRS